MFIPKKVFIVLTMEVMINSIQSKEFRVGETVNILTVNSNATGNIFDGFDGSEFIKSENIAEGRNYQITEKSCLLFEALRQYFHPNIYIDGNNSVNRLTPSRIFGKDNFEDEYLGVSRNYADDHIFRYGIVKVCKIETLQHMDVELKSWKDFPSVFGMANFGIFMNNTFVLRFKPDSETLYVSSVVTGNCLVQIYVREKSFCKDNAGNEKDIELSFYEKDEFFRNSIYKSHITNVSKNENFEHIIDRLYYLNDIDYSLHSFFKINSYYQDIIFEKFEHPYVIAYRFQSFPEIVISELKQALQRKTTPANVVPGDVISIEDLIKPHSASVSASNIDLIRDSSTSIPFATWSFGKCFQKSEVRGLNFGVGKLNYFDDQMKQQNYGIDPKYAEKSMCAEITVCSELTTQTLRYFPFQEIKVDKKTKSNTKKHFFINENVILLFSDGNEKHFVTQTEKGNCLLQVFLYQSPYNLDRLKINDSNATHKGRILSATNDPALERKVEAVTKNDLRHIIGPDRNLTMIAEIFEMLNKKDKSNEALIGYELVEL